MTQLVNCPNPNTSCRRHYVGSRALAECMSALSGQSGQSEPLAFTATPPAPVSIDSWEEMNSAAMSNMADWISIHPKGSPGGIILYAPEDGILTRLGLNLLLAGDVDSVNSLSSEVCYRVDRSQCEEEAAKRLWEEVRDDSDSRSFNELDVEMKESLVNAVAEHSTSVIVGGLATNTMQTTQTFFVQPDIPESSRDLLVKAGYSSAMGGPGIDSEKAKEFALSYIQDNFVYTGEEGGEESAREKFVQNFVSALHDIEDPGGASIHMAWRTQRLSRMIAQSDPETIRVDRVVINVENEDLGYNCSFEPEGYALRFRKDAAGMGRYEGLVHAAFTWWGTNVPDKYQSQVEVDQD